MTDGNPHELTAAEANSIDTLITLIGRFEEAGHDDGTGDKFWLARDLQTLFGYPRWDRFLEVIERAETSCRQAGHDPADHFDKVGKMVPVGSGATRDIGDIRMDRYACYLAAQNASSRLKPVAFAQTYFAIQTRRQELTDRDGTNFEALSENQRRLYLRDQVVSENKKLASAAKGAGIQSKDFGTFHNKGYQGLYGGMNVTDIQRHKGLPPKASILNHMGSTELAANLFRATQTAKSSGMNKSRAGKMLTTPVFRWGEKSARPCQN